MANNNFHALPLANLNKDSKKRKREENLRTWKWNEVIDVDAIPDKVEIKTEEITPRVVSSDEDSTNQEEYKLQTDQEEDLGEDDTDQDDSDDEMTVMMGGDKLVTDKVSLNSMGGRSIRISDRLSVAKCSGRKEKAD
ncbi:hypothetical protein Tco_1122960 [Tanacetum coccineum]|uniref:Uncharacterized protein n=1 Tax=Tanacetum coccineum TaxID=301880 RepID=A0ABQ5J3P9_9ASTR